MHVHVRDPETGKGSRRPELFRETVERIRDSKVDVVLNLTTGMGGDLVLGGVDAPLPPNDAGTDMASVRPSACSTSPSSMPEICTLDAGTMNFAAGGDYIMVNTPGMLRAMAKGIKDLGVKPEVEIFDTGDLVLLNELVKEGLIDDPAMIQLCMGIPYGAPNDVLTLQSMINNLPAGSVYSMFSIGRFQLPYAALAPMVGANVRVGLEDNLYLSKGVLASNGQLVDRAKTLLEAMNVRVHGPAGGARQAGPGQAWLTPRRTRHGHRAARLHQGRAARRRRHRRRLGSAVPDQRSRRPALRPRPRGRAQGRRDAGQRPPGVDARSPTRRCPAQGALTRAATPQEAATGVQFVQESAPENEQIKRSLLAAASEAAGADVVFGSSTSGILPTLLQSDMTHPERLVVGHPFNPVYLLPLVEVCPGEDHQRRRRHPRR